MYLDKSVVCVHMCTHMLLNNIAATQYSFNWSLLLSREDISEMDAKLIDGSVNTHIHSWQDFRRGVIGTVVMPR